MRFCRPVTSPALVQSTLPSRGQEHHRRAHREECKLSIGVRTRPQLSWWTPAGACLAKAARKTRTASQATVAAHPNRHQWPSRLERCARQKSRQPNWHQLKRDAPGSQPPCARRVAGRPCRAACCAVCHGRTCPGRHRARVVRGSRR